MQDFDRLLEEAHHRDLKLILDFDLLWPISGMTSLIIAASIPSGNSLLPVYNSNRPEVHEVVAEMRAVIDSYPGRVLIGEIYRFGRAGHSGRFLGS